MPAAISVFNNFSYSCNIIRGNRTNGVRPIIYSYKRQTAFKKLRYLIVIKIHTGGKNAVHRSIHAMFVIRHYASAYFSADKSYIISVFLNLYPETVQNSGKITMSQTAMRFILKKNPDVIGFIGLQCASLWIRKISKPFCSIANKLLCCTAYIAVIIKSFADSSNWYTALLCDSFNRNHFTIAPFT